MKSPRSFMLIVAGSLFLSSCLPPSDNSVDQSGGSTVSISPFLGTWNLTAIAEEPSEATVTLEVLDNSGTYETIASDAQKSMTKIFELAEVSGKTIVSWKRMGNGWDILEAVLQDQGNTLIIRSMDDDVVKADIESETLDGYVVKWTEQEKLLHITATSSGLRDYIANNSDLFLDLWTFEKVE